MNNESKSFIINEIVKLVKDNKSETPFRTPLVGFANAKNPLFNELRKIINKDHYLPQDLLPNGKTVVSFFIPFHKDIILSNHKDNITSTQWAYGKKNTEELIDNIIEEIGHSLANMNIRCSTNPSRETYDNEKFVHRWSQRHVAYICGLGTFGINQLLITKSGCGGRLGSFVIDAEVDYDPIAEGEYCLSKAKKKCDACIRNCPVQALGESEIQKSLCSTRINEMTDKYFGGIKIFRSCGKCIALPCALKAPNSQIF